MAPTVAPDRIGTASPFVPAPQPRRLLSPGGYTLLAAAMLLSALVVFRVTRAFLDPAGPAGGPAPHEEIDLGQMTRDLAPEPGELLREPFVIRIVLVLNPNCRDLRSLRTQVLQRRNLLRDIVWSEIIDPRSDAELRRPTVIDSLKEEIRGRLNRELGPSKDGQEILARVLFPDRWRIERR